MSAKSSTELQNKGDSSVNLLDKAFLRDYAETRGFMLGRPSKAKPTPDGKAVLFLRSQARVAQQSLFIFDVETGKSRELLSPEQVLKGAAENLSAEEKARRERQRISVGGFTDFQISDDSKNILVSLSGKLYDVNRASGQIKQLETGSEAVLDPKFSPDGKSVAYVQNYDLHILDLETGKSQRITSGGSDILSHGLAEFVAQEEMGRFSGYCWSPDSKFIAYEEANAEGVEIWYLADPTHPDQKPIANFYPRPGKPNVKVKLGIIAATGGQSTWIDWDSKKYEYLASFTWPKHGPFTILVSTRDQKEMKVLEVDTKTGKTNAIHTETDKDWLDLQKEMPCWLDDGNQFLWISERSGGKQLELHNKKTAEIKILSSKEIGLQSFVDVDCTRGVAYCLASSNPTQSHLYEIALDGKTPPVQITKSRGVHSASFSKDHSIYVHDESLHDSMPQSTVHLASGKLLGAIPSIAEEAPAAPNVEFVQLDGEHKFHARLVRPQNFDQYLSYPVIVDVYGGPGSIKVIDSRRSLLLDQWLADQGFIVVSLDGRGTPGRGRDFERAVGLHFGTIPLDDQVAGIQQLCAKYKELDDKRIGITGWSFGGYMSALAALQKPEIYKAAVAGAPVVDWFDYDSCYTERYLGLPEKHPEAYKESSLLTYAHDLKVPLLLVHGTTDDNVFFKHSLKLADALFRNGQTFEILPLSGLTHMVPDPVVMEQLWTRIISHFQKHLGVPQEGADRD